MTNTRIEIIKSMIESGADMKLMDNMGKTCMDDFLVKVKKCSPYSKIGLKYSEILKVALKNGLDNMKYGNILFDMTKRKGRDGHELDSVIHKCHIFPPSSYTLTHPDTPCWFHTKQCFHQDCQSSR